jgi:glucose/arabinose dehydrogenase
MRRIAVLTVLMLAVAACGAGSASAAKVRTVARGLQVPWGIDFLPGRKGDALVAERTTGRIIRIARPGGRKRVAMRIPGVDTNAGEGGLLGLAVSPNYARDKLIYAYFTSASDNRIVRFRLGGPVMPIVTGIASSGNHNGGRLEFGRDGKLYASTGDAGNTARSQDRGSLNGKILRLNPDGSAPNDNPFRGSRVFSMGHRNVQGLAFDRAGRLWAPEFGQDTFDEVNLIRAGQNYGWPAVEGRGTGGGRFVSPKVVWRTDQASPSGAAIRGRNLYVAALRGETVFRIRLNGTAVGRPRAVLSTRHGRIRTVVVAPDRSLWVATSNRDGRGDPRSGDDKILRLK